jgi:hypothetical protein
MERVEIYLLGYPLLIKYAIHEHGYVEWNLVASDKWESEHDLLNLLLRMHHSSMIESICREHGFYKEKFESMAPFGDEDVPF